MGENSIDGDSFLDLWMYVTIKANVPDLVCGRGLQGQCARPGMWEGAVRPMCQTWYVGGGCKANVLDLVCGRGL